MAMAEGVYLEADKSREREGILGARPEKARMTGQ